MVRFVVIVLGVACAGVLPWLPGVGPALAQEVAPLYQIILRSRSGEAVPERNRDGQTSGGYIEVVQRSPDTVLIVMRGSAVAGSEQTKPGEASLKFDLHQDFEVVPTRAKLRPPLLALSGELVGTLQSSEPEGGSGEQGPACAVVASAGQPLLKLCLKPHQVGSCQKLFVNDREGAYEAVVAAGGYCLQQTFMLHAEAPVPSRPFCPRVIPAASVVFDPDPKLETRWNYVLTAFRNLPRINFGFSVLLHVRESAPEGVLPAPLPVPLPKGLAEESQPSIPY